METTQHVLWIHDGGYVGWTLLTSGLTLCHTDCGHEQGGSRNIGNNAFPDKQCIYTKVSALHIVMLLCKCDTDWCSFPRSWVHVFIHWNDARILQLNDKWTNRACTINVWVSATTVTLNSPSAVHPCPSGYIQRRSGALLPCNTRGDVEHGDRDSRENVAAFSFLWCSLSSHFSVSSLWLSRFATLYKSSVTLHGY